MQALVTISALAACASLVTLLQQGEELTSYSSRNLQACARAASQSQLRQVRVSCTAPKGSGEAYLLCATCIPCHVS